MKRNDQNNPQTNGYPQQNGYNPDTYAGGMPYQGYPSQQGYAQQPGYPSAQGYQAPQGYSQGYPQQPAYFQGQGYPQQQGYQQGRSYQTPQVTGSQTPMPSQEASPAYTGQGSFAQGGYPQGYAQAPAGYSGNPYSQQPAAPAAPQGYGYPGSQPSTGSYIPQTPYQQGYTGQGYQAPSGYAQGYSAYQQMGRGPQMPVPPQQEYGQVPLNGGGYVPQPVPVRKRPFVLSDAYLLVLCAVLLILFALGMFAPGLGILKTVFLILAAGTTALLWIRPMVDGNKRLCYTIVFGLLILVTVISLLTGGSGGKQDGQGLNQDPQNNAVSSTSEINGQQVSVLEVTPTPAVTYTPEPDLDGAVTQRLREFFNFWMANRQEDMLTLCSPTWKSKQENPQRSLFGLMSNRIPKDYFEENISGTSNDDTRTITITSTMDRNNGKEDVKYRINVIMVRENDGLWYVDPESIQSNEKADTPDPNVTDTPAPTATPETNANTVLYYNPNKGEFYHRDQNCKRINEKYLPLQGHFTYSQINDEPYSKLKPCAICGAPSR